MIERARLLSNQRVEDEAQGFMTDDEIIVFLDSNWQALYNDMVTARELYFKKDVDFTIYGENNQYEIEDDFYKILKLDYNYSSPSQYKYETKEVSLLDENQLNNRGENYFDFFFTNYDRNNVGRGYYLQNERTIVLLPKIRAAGTYNLSYVPVCPHVQDHNISLPPGFQEWLSARTAINMATPEEGDLKNLEKEFMFWDQKVKKWMAERSNLAPKSIRRSVDLGGRRIDRINSWWYGDNNY